MAMVMAAFRQAQPEGVSLIQHAYLDWLDTEESNRAAKYKQFRDYYDGDHLTALTARMRAFLELKADQEFNLNIIPIVVDCLAERLKVKGFATEDNPDVLKSWWNANRMDAVQCVLHLSAVRDGDSYLLVEWDNEVGRPRFTHENAWDGTQGMHVVYSDERRDKPLVAIKRWITKAADKTPTRRTNLYFADRIEKYTDAGTGGDWLQFTDADNPEWPLPWLDKEGKPLGVPVIHWRNKDQGYSYGQSEEDIIIPVQNGLNKAAIDLIAAADTTGFQMLTATGYDADANPVKVAPGELLWSTNPDAKFGTIPAAALDALIAVKDTAMADAAKITRTPLSFFQLTGQVAAAGTLKEQRAGLNSKIADRQVTFGNSWEDAMNLAKRLQMTFGSGVTLDLEAAISTEWTPADPPSDMELAEEVNLLAQAQAASIKTKVRKLHPEWDTETIDKEVAAIKAELMVPDVGPLP